MPTGLALLPGEGRVARPVPQLKPPRDLRQEPPPGVGASRDAGVGASHPPKGTRPVPRRARCRGRCQRYREAILIYWSLTRCAARRARRRRRCTTRRGGGTWTRCGCCSIWGRGSTSPPGAGAPVLLCPYIILITMRILPVYYPYYDAYIARILSSAGESTPPAGAGAP